MKLQEERASNLNRIAEAVAGVEGVLAAILFGSRARGDEDRYSDYDLLIIFSNKDVMWRNFERLFERISETGLFIQAMPVALEEKEKIDKTFLETVLKDGILLYQRYPLTTPASLVNFKPTAIVTYTLKSLPQREKLKLSYSLYGRKTGKYKRTGIVEDCGGLRIGKGAVGIPWERRDKLTQILDKHKVMYKVTKALMPETAFPAKN